MTIEFKTVVSDPDFYALPINERRKVLISVAPDFKGLPTSEQDKVLQGLEQQFMPKPITQQNPKIRVPNRTLSTHIPQSPEMELQAAHTRMSATAQPEFKPSGLVRPTLETLLGGAGTIAGIPGGPIGMAGGGALGIVAGKTLADYLEGPQQRANPFTEIPALPGEKRPTPISIDTVIDPLGEFITPGSTTDVLTKPVRETVGLTALAGPAEAAARGVMATLRAGKGVIQWAKAPQSISTKAAEKKAADYLRANTSEGDVFAKNIDEAKALEAEINEGRSAGVPEFKFSLGERSFDPNQIKAQQAIDLPQGKAAIMKVEQAKNNSAALRDYYQRNFPGEEDVDNVLEALQDRQAEIKSSKKGAEKAVDFEIDRTPYRKPQEAGAEILSEIEAEKIPVRKTMEALKKEIPDYPMKMDNLKTQIELIKRDPTLDINARRSIENFEKTDLPELIKNGETTYSAWGIKRTLDAKADALKNTDKSTANLFKRLKREGIQEDIAALSEQARSGKILEYEGKLISADEIAAQLEDDVIALAEARQATQPDVAAMKQGIKDSGGRVPMQVVRETEDQYIARLSQDYKNLTKQDPPTTAAASPEIVKKLEDRITENRKILSEAVPGQDVGAAMSAFNKYASENWFGRFDKGGIREVTAKGAEAAGTRIRLERIPDVFKTADRADDLIRAVGPERAKEAMQGSFGYDLLNFATGQDGKIVGSKLNLWLSRNKDVLAKYGLSNEFSSLQNAQKAVDEISTIAADFERSVAGQMLGGKIDRMVDPGRVVARILGGDRTAADMRQVLLIVKSDPAAVKGLKNAFGKWVTDYSETTWKQLAENKGTTSQAMFTRGMKKANEAAQVLYADEPEKLKALQTMQRAYEVAARSSRAPAGVGSPTAEKVVNAIAQNAMNFAVGNSRTAQAAKYFWNVLGKHRQAVVDEFIARGIYDPDYAYVITEGANGRLNQDMAETIVNNKIIRLDDYKRTRSLPVMVGTQAENQGE